MLRKTLFTLTAVVSCLTISQQTFGTFIPEEDIKDKTIYSARDANMTKQEFGAVIDKAAGIYKPIVSSHGANLTIKKLWNDDTPNASAQQQGSSWIVNMYGGLARHPEMTLDGFTMVLCHELGHHLAGFSFVKNASPFPFPLPFPVPGGGLSWAANEGQSDYFAAHSCSRELWQDEVDVNATFRGTVKPNVQASCDAVWSTTEDQDLCYRINAGGESLARTLSALGKDPTPPTYETPASNKVNETNHKHPKAQCRLDTAYAASLCTQPFDVFVIPGKKMDDNSGPEAERESSKYTCMEISNFSEGLRPRCWFKPGV